MATLSSTSTTASGLTVQNATNDNTDEDSESWICEPTPRIVSLAVFICFGFLGNLFLIITLCQSRRFRSVAFYVFIINLAVVNICETSLNMSLLLSSSIVENWTFGEIPCQLNAFLMHLVCTETFLGLTILTTDRMIAVRYRESYDKVISTHRITILIVFTWILSLAFSLPILLGAVPVSMNKYIKYCNISAGSSITYNVFQAFFCVFLPLTLMIIFFIKIIRTGYKDRVLVRTLISQHNYNDDAAPEPRIKQEIRYANLTGTLCVTWLLVEGPHVATSYFRQFQGSSELENVADKELHYVWYVDLILLWLRFSYTMVLPVAAFVWHKELWKSFKDIVLCRKNNSIVDESFKKNESDTQKLERKIKEEQKLKENESIVQIKEDRVFHVPVLFATSQGVHIQTFEQTDTSDADENDESSGKGTMRGRKCDVIGSRDNLNNMEEDTSDYDSGNEVDPFSVSHPISVKQFQSNDLTDRHRSSSQPEVRDKIKSSADKSYGQTVGSTSAGDSGLDLSTGNYISMCNKSEFHKPHGNPDKVGKETLVQNDSSDSGAVMDNTLNQELIKQNHVETGDLSKGVYMSPSKVNSNTNRTTPHVGSQRLPSSGHLQNDVSVDITPATKHTGSPAPRRKKKKRRGSKSSDCRSNTPVPSSPVLPLRPPPRLAPITNTSSKTVCQSAIGHGVPLCSDQLSCTENNTECVQSQLGVLGIDSNVEVANSDTRSCDNLSISSFTSTRHSGQRKSNSDTCSHIVDLHEHKSNSYTSKRDCPCLPEESETSTECQTSGSCTHEHKNSGVINAGYEQDIDETSPRHHKHEDTRRPNCEARKKRREKLTTSMLLNDNGGYERLMPDTP